MLSQAHRVDAIERDLRSSAARSRWFTVAFMLSMFLTAWFAPSVGAYTLLGMYPGIDTNRQDPQLATQLDAFVHWTGKNNVIVNVYGDPREHIHDLTTIWNQGGVPLLSWSPNPATVASRADDAAITADALAVKQWLAGCSTNLTGTCQDRRIYIRYDYEMNIPSQPWSPCNSTNEEVATADGTTAQQQFVAAWKHVHDIFMGTGPGEMGLNNTQVAWVFAVSAPVGSDCPITSATYPSGGYVDWFGMDGYSYTQATEPTPNSVFDTTLQALHSLDSSRPVGITEAGVNSGEGTSTKNAWIDNYFTYVSANNLEMALWYNANSNGPTRDGDPWAIFDEQYPLNGLDGQLPYYGDQQIDYSCCSDVDKTWWGFSRYNADVQASWVIGGSFTNPNPRIITDAQFLGQ